MRYFSLKHLLMSVLLLALNTAAATATVTVLPAFPTPADSVTVRVDDSFPTGLQWQITGTECRMSAPDSLVITLTLQFCNGQPGCGGTLSPTFFTRSCRFAPLAVGTYKAVFVERYLNPNDPRPADVALDPTPRTVAFVVTGPTPALKRSWGRLKAAYR